jgi:hypothetical protein
MATHPGSEDPASSSKLAKASSQGTVEKLIYLSNR